MSSIGKTVIWLCVIFTLVIANQVPPHVQSTRKCDGLKNKLQIKNFPYKTIGSDDHLGICVNNNSTCCTHHMEKQLHKLSKKALKRIISAKTDLIKKIFSEGLATFDGFFTDLINESEKQMDEIFMSIYKTAYVNNSHITSALYSRLRKYYSDGGVDPKEIISGFFQNILKKMFVLLNPTANVDINCVGKNMDVVNPFGNVPRIISIQVERSFTAARTFVYGITTGKIVVDRITEYPLTENCLKSVTKMTQCSLCDGQSNVKPCAGYCKTVYAHCFASLMVLENVWGDYLKQMHHLAVKLEGPFDIEAVASTLHFEISNGIMNYQKNDIKHSTKFIKACKKTGRTGRSLTSSDSDFFLDNNDKLKRSAKKRSTISEKPSLDSLTKTYKGHFMRLNKFWTKLSVTMCDQTVVANNATDKQCWDGANVVNNTKSVYQQLVVKPVKNGQIEPDIQILINKLNSAITSLKTAISGKTVKLPVTFGEGDDDDVSGSGSGSASGSGHGEPTVVMFTNPTTVQPSNNIIDEPTKTECGINCVDNGDQNVVVSMSGRGTAGSFSVSIFLLTVMPLLYVILVNC